jgi:hypothetical protein
MIVDDKRRWKHKINKKSVTVVDDMQRQGYKLQFKSGVDPIFARKLKAKLSTKGIVAAAQPLQILRVDNSNNRWQVDSTGKVTMTENKLKVMTPIDIALLAHDYDLRISTSTENNIADSNTSSSGNNGINYNAWQQERHKRRVSYTHSAHSSWRMDYTEVDIRLNPAYGAAAASGGRTREIEFELELNDAVKMKWLQEPDQNASVELTRYIVHDLIALIDLLVPFDSEDTTETSLVQADYGEELFRANDIVHPGRRQFEFLGSMPVNLSRQNLVSVTHTKYYLTEKSDGIRYLMYVIHDPTANKPVAVLVNRSKKAFRFRGSFEIGSFLPVGSILDGELVFNRTMKENVFLLFDVLAWAGVSYVKQNFSVRTELIHSQVMAMHDERLKQWLNGGGHAQTPPIRLVRKSFVDKSEIQSALLSLLRTEDGERVFYRDPNRHHKSDGIIFQPDSEYVFSRHYDLLKWKWAELRSVDLQVANNPQTNELCLMCGGDEGSQINCTKRGGENIGLGVYDTYRLRADMEDPSMDKRAAAVVEVAYDTIVGMWEYMQLRRDKSEPNYIATVMGVFMEQAESIGVEELEYILNAAASGAENDYEFQTAKMKTKLLDWQRNECANKKKHSQKMQGK